MFCLVLLQGDLLGRSAVDHNLDPLFDSLLASHLVR